MSKLAVNVSSIITAVDTTDAPWLSISQDIEGLEFSTGLPGGFIEAQMSLSLPGSRAAWWYENMIGGNIQITDTGEIMWEGRINNIKFVRQKVVLDCRGYWVGLTDLINYSFWTEGRLGGWEAINPDIFGGLATDADMRFDRFSQNAQGALFATPQTGISTDNYCGWVWTFAPDIVGGNTPKVDPRAIYRVKGHIYLDSEPGVGLDGWFFKIFVTDQPYTDAIGDWTLIHTRVENQVATPVDEDFDVDISYAASPVPLAIMFQLGNESILPAPVAAAHAYAAISNIELRVVRSDDVSSVTAKSILNALIASNSDYGPASPEHLCLSTETLFIEDPGIEIIPFISEGLTVQEIANKLSQYGDDQTPPREWYPAVWGGRRLHFKPKQTDTVHWIVRKAELDDEGAELERSLENYWPEVYAHHIDLRERDVWSTLKDDFVTAQPLSLARRFQIFADVKQAAVADILRDAQHEFTKRPQQQASIDITGHIMNGAGVRYPLWRVKAGDVISIIDLAARSFTNDEIDVTDPLKTFFIKETKYDLKDNKLTVTPEFPTNRLDILTSRLTDLTFE